MSNIVYVLTNLAMPGLVKIGKITRERPRERVVELYTTGVPLPFECAFAFELKDQKADDVEKALHTKFDDYRPNPSREFFEIEPEKVEATLRKYPGKIVTPNLNKAIWADLDVDSRKAFKKAMKSQKAKKAKRATPRPDFDLYKMGMEDGDKLLIIVHGDKKGKVTVKGPQEVFFQGQTVRLGKVAALLGINNGGHPCRYFNFYDKKTKKLEKLGKRYEEVNGPRG